MIKLKRVYDAPSKEDGYRILVERLWPRGLSKERVAANLWLKELAPTAELRKWFAHEPERWEEFQKRYWAKLEQRKDQVDLLKLKCREGKVTLIFAARDEQRNSAVALKAFLERIFKIPMVHG